MKQFNLPCETHVKSNFNPFAILQASDLAIFFHLNNINLQSIPFDGVRR